MQNLPKVVKMRIFCKKSLLAAVLLFAAALLCSAQNEAPQAGRSFDDAPEPDYDEIIAKQVEELIDRYKLDDSQAFRVDTLLQHYVPAYNDELRRVKSSGAAQAASYQSVIDKWGDFFDSQYERIFTDEQWKSYMKSYAGKEKKKRDKRLAASRDSSAR